MKKMIAALAVLFSLTITGCELLVSPKSDDSSGSQEKVTGKVTVTVYGGDTLPVDAKVQVRLFFRSSKSLASRVLVTPDYSKTVAVTATSGTTNYHYSISGVADGTYSADATVVAHDGSSLASAGGGTASSFTVTGGSGTVADMSVTYGTSGGAE